MNVRNIEYWKNNLLKAYIYFIGLTAVIAIPIILVIDCIKPILGRGPHSDRDGKRTTPRGGSGPQGDNPQAKEGLENVTGKSPPSSPLRKKKTKKD